MVRGGNGIAAVGGWRSVWASAVGKRKEEKRRGKCKLVVNNAASTNRRRPLRRRARFVLINNDAQRNVV